MTEINVRQYRGKQGLLCEYREDSERPVYVASNCYTLEELRELLDALGAVMDRCGSERKGEP